MNQITRLMTSIFNHELKEDASNQAIKGGIISDTENYSSGKYLPPEGMKWDEYCNPVFMDGLSL